MVDGLIIIFTSSHLFKESFHGANCRVLVIFVVMFRPLQQTVVHVLQGHVTYQMTRGESDKPRDL